MMRVIVVLATLCVALGNGVIKSGELHTITFDTFLRRMGLSYSPRDYAMREALFNAELKRVQAHNVAGKTWTETLTRFSVMTTEEKKTKTHGRNKLVHQGSLKSGMLSASAPTQPQKLSDSLPANVDWRMAGIVGTVKDQGHCGSCWAFASTAVIESHVAKATGYLFDLSPQQIAMCSPNPNKCGGSGGCEGATAEVAFDYIAKAGGILEEYQLGYAAYYGSNTTCVSTPGPYKASIGGYVTLMQNDYASLMNALAFVGPVAVSVDASNWHAYEGGVFNGCNNDSPDINHAVVAVGYGVEADGTTYWLVRNSWSSLFGEKGYIKIFRGDADNQPTGTDVTPQNGTGCEGQTEPVKVSGTCGILYDSAYPVGAKLTGTA